MQSKPMAHSRYLMVALAAVAIPWLQPIAASGQPRPVDQHTITRGARTGTPAPKVKIGPHTRFGTIVSLQTNAFVMRTRAQRLLNVDDTVPLQAGTYSFPLFVGKLVMVTGDIDASGVMHADTIMRVPLLDPRTPGDH